MAQTQQHAAQHAQHGNGGTAPAEFVKRSVSYANGEEVDYDAAPCFAVGHVMTEPQAKWCNVRVAWFATSAFAKKHKDDKTPATQAEFDAYIRDFNRRLLAGEVAVREIGTGKTIRERAAAIVADSIMPGLKGRKYKPGEENLRDVLIDRVLDAVENGTASAERQNLFDDALAKLKAEAEAKRGIKSNLPPAPAPEAVASVAI